MAPKLPVNICFRANDRSYSAVWISVEARPKSWRLIPKNFLTLPGTLIVIPKFDSSCNFAARCTALLSLVLAIVPCANAAAQKNGGGQPVVARIEMKLAIDDKVIDVIEKGDLLTVIEERDDDYVILTHDGSTGAVDKDTVAKIAESGQIYTDLIKDNPEEGRYYTLRASAWWTLGDAEKAKQDFDKAIELGYEESHAYTSRGLFHAEMGEFEKAIEDYNKALEIEPEAIAPIINRAAVRMSQREYKKAVEDYTLVLSKKENASSILHQRAIAHKAGGDLKSAVEDFSALLEQNPDDRAAVMGRGYIRFQQADHQAAVADFSKAIELNNQDPVAFNNRGYNLVQLGRDKEALPDYEKALKLAPKYALALQNRAWLLAISSNSSVRDPEAAIESAKAACELTNYTVAGDLSALAAALAADGQFKEAIEWQVKVIELVADPYKDFAEKTLNRYQNDRVFAADPDKANAADDAAAEATAKAEKEAEADANLEAEDATS